MIDTQEKLAAFLPVVNSAAWLALDTEADSLHAYPEKVCLIQISTADGDRLVDPLAGIDINPFLDALAGRELIFHAADYDLRLLRKHHEFTPSVIFDTMLAARLLGERQFGLSSLVEKFLGVKLDKGSQKADWARRPLTQRMETYARNDTRHLKPLEEKLQAELNTKGRLAWHQESCARLIAECSQPVVVDEDAVWRIKGSTFLERAALAVLRELWHWREREASPRTARRFLCCRTTRWWKFPRPSPNKSRRTFDSAPDAPAPAGKSAGRHPRRAGRAAGKISGKNPPPLAASDRGGVPPLPRTGKDAATGTRTNWALTHAHRAQIRPRRPRARLGQARGGIDELAAGIVEVIWLGRRAAGSKC